MNILKNKTIFSFVISSTIVLSACSGDSQQNSSESTSDLSLAKDTPIAFVERGVAQSSSMNNERFDKARMNEGQTPLELYSPYVFTPGAKLFERSGIDADAVNSEILGDYFNSTVYDVKDLNISASGEKLIFAAHGPLDHPTDYTWNIYEFDFETKSLRRVIEDIALANAGQDTNPAYTLDGDIVFSSDRSSGNPNSPVTNIVPDPEYCYKINPKEKPSLLHSMTDQGANILQLTYGNNHDTHPTTLKDGRIVFIRTSFSYQQLEDMEAPTNRLSRDTLLRSQTTAESPWGLSKPQNWDSTKLAEYSESTPVGRVIASNNYTLLRITADGEELEQLYETVSVEASDEEFVYIDRIVQAENGQLVGVLKHKFNESLGGDLLIFGSPNDPAENKVFGNVAPSSLIEGSTGLYPNQLPKNGWYSALWPYRDGSGRLLVSWSQCLTNNNGVNGFCDNEVAGNGEPSQYGIWVYDVESKSRLPVVRAKDNTVYDDVALSRSHVGLDFPFDAFNPDYTDNVDGSQIICNYPEPVNTAPVANAGPDQSVYSNSTVTLNGSASSDSDNDLITYYWSLVSQPSGSAVNLDNNTSVSPSFVANEVGSYVFQLVVNDGELDSLADTVTINSALEVINRAPIANAGQDQQALLGSIVDLNGTASSDPDGDSLSYEWRVLSPEGIESSIFSDASAASPSFDATIIGTYVMQLVVSDGQLSSAPDTVSIVVDYPNRAPIAEAGNNQQPPIGSSLLLNGSASSDPDGDALNYQWSVLGDSNGVVLTNPNEVMPSIQLNEYGSFVVQLIVNDGVLSSAPDTITLDVINSRPVADAGADINAQLSELTVLDGSASYDPDGSDLTYSWTLSSIPEGSNTTLSNSQSESPSLTPDTAGAYTAQLIVTDGVLDSIADTVNLSVSAELNTAPIANAGMDQQVSMGSTYTLDGSASNDAEGDVLSYSWNVISPIGVSLNNPNSVRPTIDINEYGTYIVELIVNDGQLDSVPDTVLLEFENVKPVANAGQDQSVPVNSDVTLNGSASSDVNGDTLSYTWQILQSPEGSTSSLDDENSINPQLVTDEQGSYLIQLIVNDGLVDSDPDTVIVTTPNTIPVANAGVDSALSLGVDLILDGSGSYDADGDTLTYQWSLINTPIGSSSTLINPTEINPSLESVDTYGDYVVQLIVSDGTDNSSPDTVILSSQNLAPIADAGIDLDSMVDEQINLDGSASYDPQSDALSYSWSLLSVPEGSTSVLFNANTVSPNLTPDVKGQYIAQLIVNDGLLNSVPDTVSINADQMIDDVDVIESCENLAHQNTVINLDFVSTNQAFPDGAEGQCNWQYTENQGGNFIQGQYRQSIVADLPENAIVCSSSLTANSGGETNWSYDDEFYLTVGDKVIVSSARASTMDNLVDPDNANAYGEGEYIYDFSPIRNLAYEQSSERYCLGQPRVWDIFTETNASCSFPQTQNTGVFNIDISDEAFAGVSADIVNEGQAEFSLIITGDNDNSIDCQHTGIDLNWNVEYVLPAPE